MGATPPKPKPKNNLLKFTEEDIRARAYEIWLTRNDTSNNNNGKYNPEDDWNAAIESLRLERSRSRRINVYLWKTFTSPYRFTKKSTEKMLSPFTNREDRNFNLDVVKTLISVSSVIATVVAGIGLFVTYDNNNERLITDRFSKAVEQLGNDKLEIRLGGIYALERISKDSHRDYWTVMEVLTAFVREHAKETPKRTEKQITPLPKKTTEKQIASTQTSTDEEQIYPPTTDIQAALTVIGRRKLSYKNGENNPLDLSNTNLQGADLNDANLQGAKLLSANLQGTYLSSANLQGANLGFAKLQGAYLGFAKLQGADLLSANLQGANLGFANLQGANLGFAKLQGADLSKANLQGADLSKANLKEVMLFDANLQEAILFNANLQEAILFNANLQGANLGFANLQGADLSNTKSQEAQYTDKNTSREKCRTLFFLGKDPCPTLFPPNFDPKAAGMKLVK